MPRVLLRQEEYMAQDLSDFIRNEMRHRKISQKEMGLEIGSDQSGFSRKLKKADFNVRELISIFMKLETDADKVGSLLRRKQ